LIIVIGLFATFVCAKSPIIPKSIKGNKILAKRRAWLSEYLDARPADAHHLVKGLNGPII
jgi:hypothetical protein